MQKKSYQNSDYFQPNFYHFSQDSTKLADFVSSEVSNLKENSWCMDVGAGCGIVGMEILKKLNRKLNFDFLEIQNDFKDYFNKNLESLGQIKKFCTFHHTDFRKFLPQRKYSLMVSNPPYFTPGSGKPSQKNKKNKCRFFEEGSYGELIEFFKFSLTEKGRGYILFREKQKFIQETLRTSCDDFSFKIKELDEKTNLLVISVLDKQGDQKSFYF